jgi:hypothetical protein
VDAFLILHDPVSAAVLTYAEQWRP